MDSKNYSVISVKVEIPAENYVLEVDVTDERIITHECGPDWKVRHSVMRTLRSAVAIRGVIRELLTHI
jgi:hypothetical protein